jgi:hypothetical protein
VMKEEVKQSWIEDYYGKKNLKSQIIKSDD